jgi:hypothetical protein
MAKVLAVSQKGNMLKIENTNEAKGYIWYFLTEDVIKFVANNSIVAGTEVEFKAEEIKGEDTITFIKKLGSETQFKCKTCGKELKDNKYETCYDCSMKARKAEEASPEGKARQDSIERQAILKCSANAVAVAMQGKVDVNVLGDMIEVLYNKLLKVFYK